MDYLRQRISTYGYIQTLLCLAQLKSRVMRGVSKKHTLCKKEVAHEALLFGPYGSGIYGDDAGGNGCPGFGAAGRVRVGLFRRRLVCSVLLVT